MSCTYCTDIISPAIIALGLANIFKSSSASFIITSNSQVHASCMVVEDPVVVISNADDARPPLKGRAAHVAAIITEQVPLAACTIVRLPAAERCGRPPAVAPSSSKDARATHCSAWTLLVLLPATISNRSDAPAARPSAAAFWSNKGNAGTSRQHKYCCRRV